MRSSLGRCLSLLLVVLGAAPLAACAYSGGPVEGHVREEGSDRPIPGAIVIVRWQGSAFSFVESPTVCIHVELATTDEQGRFRTSAWRAEVEPAGVRHLTASVVAHKTGYEWSNVLAKTEEIQYLKPSTQSRAERLDYLSRVSSATRCGEAGASGRNLLMLKKALHEEAKQIAVTAQDRDAVETLLFGVESLEFGSMEALRRMEERRKASK